MRRVSCHVTEGSIVVKILVITSGKDKSISLHVVKKINGLGHVPKKKCVKNVAQENYISHQICFSYKVNTSSVLCGFSLILYRLMMVMMAAPLQQKKQLKFPSKFVYTTEGSSGITLSHRFFLSPFVSSMTCLKYGGSEKGQNNSKRTSVIKCFSGLRRDSF